MPWLKYRHKFSHGKGTWEWRDLGAEADPCGVIEWRGEDMPLTDRLIGWDRAGSGRAVRHDGQPQLFMKPVDEKRQCAGTTRIERPIGLSEQSPRKDSP